MKSNYDDILAKATAFNTSNHERREIYRANPEVADKLKQDVELSTKIGRLQQTGPDARAAFKAVLDNISADDINSARYSSVATTVSRAQGHGWAAQLKVYLPMAGLLIAISLAGVVWLRSSQPTSNTSVAPVANGSVSSANSAMIQDSIAEQTNAVSSDGATDIYTASADSLKRMGSSVDANF